MDKLIHFNRFEVGKKNTVYLPEKMRDIYANFISKKYKEIPEVDINGHHLYVSGMKEFDLGDDINRQTHTATHRRAYVINISNVQPGEDINYADIDLPVDERAKKVDKSTLLDATEDADNVGPLTYTQIVVDPSRRVVGSCSGSDRLNGWYIAKILKSLLQTPAMKLSIILDKQGIEDIRNLEITTAIQYSISSPDHFKDFRNERYPEKADLKFANYLKGNKISMVIEYPNMPKRKVIKKVKELLADENTSKVKVAGLDDGVETTVDPVKHKLSYRGEVVVTGTPNERDYVNFLQFGYLQVYDFVKSMYDAEVKLIIED